METWFFFLHVITGSLDVNPEGKLVEMYLSGTYIHRF